jgi:hypothetical protein
LIFLLYAERADNYAIVYRETCPLKYLFRATDLATVYAHYSSGIPRGSDHARVMGADPRQAVHHPGAFRCKLTRSAVREVPGI